MVWSDLEFPGQGSKIMNYEVTIRKLGRACSGNPVNGVVHHRVEAAIAACILTGFQLEALYGVNGR